MTSGLASGEGSGVRVRGERGVDVVMREAALKRTLCVIGCL